MYKMLKNRMHVLIFILLAFIATPSNAGNKVVVIPLAADDSHDHDDRYFGFGHTLQSAIVENGATLSRSNVSFPATGTPRMRISFGLPPGRINGRPILLQLPFQVSPNCTFVLSATGVAGPFADSTRFLNTSWEVVGSPNGTVEVGPNPTGVSLSTTVVTFLNRSSSRLNAGASVEMVLTRNKNDVNDTCLGTVVARGGFSVEY